VMTEAVSPAATVLASPAATVLAVEPESSVKAEGDGGDGSAEKGKATPSQVSFLGNAKSSLGDAKSSLGDAKSSLGAV
jgi:hypothetical protein